MANKRKSLLDNFGNMSQIMISSPQSQFKMLGKKIKSKSEAVIKNLNVLRKLRIAQAYDVFEIEKLNDCKYKEQEIYEILRFEGQEDGRIHQSIENNNTTREHLMAKETVIEKCLINSTAQRIEHQTKMFDALSKKYEDCYSNLLESKEDSRKEEAKVRAEIKSIENKMDEIEDGILNIDKEFSVLEQTDNKIDLELEKYQAKMDLHKTNGKELNQTKTDLESDLKKLEKKNQFAAEQENSIAEINGSKKLLINECEKLIYEKTKLQDHVQQLDIELETFSSLMTLVTNKAEIFRLESDDKFLCILSSDEYVKSKSKFESIMKDNKTMMNELESLHKCDETLTTSINETKRELKLSAEVLAEMEMKKKSFEDDLRKENENLQQGMLKAQEEDKKMIRVIQQLHNEAENLRMEELYGQEAFNSNKITWNLKFKEELKKLNELKKKKVVESSLPSATSNQEASLAPSSNTNSNTRSEKGESQNRTFSTSSKRKSSSSSSVKSVKQMKPSAPIEEIALDEQETDDEENEFNITFNTDNDFFD